jgi:hypothetical protein
MEIAAYSATPRIYDLICFGDEVPGLLAVVAAAREFRRRTGKLPKTLVMFKGDSQQGVGGHLVRGGLGYLDRTHVSTDERSQWKLGLFGDPCSLYKEFLTRSSVNQIALDPRKANSALRQMLSDAGTDLISRIQIDSVQQSQGRLTGVRLSNGVVFLASQFIDCSVNAELCQYAEVPKLIGFDTFGLPESELPVGMIFETEGLSVQRLQQIELNYLRRFTTPSDPQAQQMLSVAGDRNPHLTSLLKGSLQDAQGRLRSMFASTPDCLDVPSKALSIAYHAFRNKPFLLRRSRVVFDSPNIAVFPDGRLSWNSVLGYVSGSESEEIARAGAKPTPELVEEMKYVQKFLTDLGATAVRPATELYIRHAGNVTDVVEPLTMTRMYEGGVDRAEALATFGYHLDVRGGITGIQDRAHTAGWQGSIMFERPPLFNVGIRHALVKSIPNLAVVSPASGFTGYACGAGRIVEFNAAVGQGVGIAAAIALANGRDLASIRNLEVRQVLEQTKLLPIIYGKRYTLEASRAGEWDRKMVIA